MPAKITGPRVLMTVGSWTEQIRARLLRLGAADVFIVDTVEEAKRDYRKATHVLLPGGADIQPQLYGEKRTFSHNPDLYRDYVEWALVGNALKHGKPIMGICRGHQMIAASVGFKLYQDIYFETGLGHINGRDHLVYPTESSEGGNSIKVNSYHHQAVREDKVPKHWEVLAYSEEGLVESIGSDKHQVISVQWHPEVLQDQNSIGLFRKFLAMKR